MAKVMTDISDDLAEFIRNQPMFFVGSAPLSGDGHVNVSPKGCNAFRILGRTRVAYLDLNGSGNETSAHLAENGRITFMFCSFQENPMILRLFGQGYTVLPDAPEWAELARNFGSLAGVRQIIVADINRVQTSCGFGVPRMEVVGQRDTLVRWAKSQGKTKMRAYQRKNNQHSIDGVRAPLADYFERTETVDA